MSDSSGAEIQHEPDNAVRALRAATNILSDIAAGVPDSYVTPYATPMQSDILLAKAISNGVNGNQTAIVDSTQSSSSEAPPHGSQIDNLLRLAAGGVQSDEEEREEDLMNSSTDESSQHDNHSSTAKPDIAVSATLQRIVNELMADSDGGNDPSDAGVAPAFSVGSSQTDHLGLVTVKEQAAALKRLFLQAGVSINTIIPVAQSLATSQLYAHLSNRANRCSASRGGINPAHANAYGNTAQMTQQMLARHGASLQVLRPASFDSRGNVMGQPMRKRTAEELRKIEGYGYPPLPGFKVGEKRKRWYHGRCSGILELNGRESITGWPGATKWMEL